MKTFNLTFSFPSCPIELNPELVNIAYDIGLNIQKTCENSLKEAIRRLESFIPEKISVRNAEAA